VTAVLAVELHPLVAEYPGSHLVEGADPLLIEIPRLELPHGWSAAATPVWFAVPSGYPAAQPDCFWADGALRLASGTLPQNSALQTLPTTNRPVLWFSWHLGSWRPGRDRLLSYARFVTQRFADAR
jgi:Prokaryotic E2 family E